MDRGRGKVKQLLSKARYLDGEAGRRAGGQALKLKLKLKTLAERFCTICSPTGMHQKTRSEWKRAFLSLFLGST